MSFIPRQPQILPVILLCCVCGCICVLDCIIPFLMIPFSSLMFALSPYHPVCTSECFWGFTFHRRVKGATVCVQRAVPSLCCLLWILHQWIPLPPRTLYTCVCVWIGWREGGLGVLHPGSLNNYDCRSLSQSAGEHHASWLVIGWLS